jgi:hypothetical protein
MVEGPPLPLRGNELGLRDLQPLVKGQTPPWSRLRWYEADLGWAGLLLKLLLQGDLGRARGDLGWAGLLLLPLVERQPPPSGWLMATITIPEGASIGTSVL